jgi:hypothetical protein
MYVLTATGQFDSCELLLIVLLKRWAELGYQAGAFDREGLDIYSDHLLLEAQLLGVCSYQQ